jgi:hypothetical protein
LKEEKTNPSDESLRFLLEEFNQCFSQMRHHDEMELSLAKFAFSLYSVVATVSFALGQYFHETPSVRIFLCGLLLLTFLISFMVIVMLVRHRIYFVYVARQVNSIRKTFLSIPGSGRVVFENFGIIDTGKPKLYYWRSAHLVLILLLSLINSITLAFAGFFLLQYLSSPFLFFCVMMPLLLVLSFLAEISFIRRELEVRHKHFHTEKYRL